MIDSVISLAKVNLLRVKGFMSFAKKTSWVTATLVFFIAVGFSAQSQLRILPGAETEFSLILKQCGFKLADGGTTDKPDIEISGEAFSAYGLQKGNLISCKSRVEIKVREVATANILVSERQTSVGVDVAEQTAAKTALQNAAGELAERIIPQLAK